MEKRELLSLYSKKFTEKILPCILPAYFSAFRELYEPNINKKQIVNSVRRTFREALVLFPALYFMLNYPFVDFSIIFALTFIAVYSIYEIGYLYNDVVRVKYDDVPMIRPYTKIINVKIAVLIRIFYLILIGLALKQSLLWYITAIAIMGFAILNHNLRTEKMKKPPTFSFLRTAKYMFIPLVTSNFNLDVVLACLLLLLPFFALDCIVAVVSTIVRYGHTLKISFDQPYYVWLISFLPLQLILLLKYTPLIFIGEAVLILISLVKHV